LRSEPVYNPYSCTIFYRESLSQRGN